ncbi:DEAD/DEAH box helicase [Homoserinibacter sp. GY 40078]|uniref:DEAD/DEAH box helicase n=1 Tax=Homoserinibacter sp. GY 40078 TaxID=2603275 RepID=UPI0011CB864A|nr:DEAD/DEAH box helicase [Homoserinibacter sp. GY 40078]TXK18637.1 DEAD/DEAH box helicase [Homoserinibacter sp. GY 40078]
MTTDFGTLGVPFPLLDVLGRQGITSPFPIQAETLPDTLAGRDVLGRGRTGSGKTLAFGLPLVARLGSRTSSSPRRSARPLGLVLAPTRELASQIDATLKPLAAAYGLTTTTVFGGVSMQKQVQALRAGVDIVVACPGRLKDLMGQGHIRLDDVEITVLDEADHMADLGFLPGVTRILAATPDRGQRMLFSATLDSGVDRLAKRFLHQPVHHGAEAPDIPVEAMEHHVFEVADATAKRAVVEALASGSGRRILFTRTKHVAKRWARTLTEAGIPAADLHGNLSQGQRERNLARFASGEIRVLVATDIAARGVHVDEVELVVHVDPPAEHKAYLHRSGRTARGGSTGAVVTLSLPEQRSDVAALLRKANISAVPTPTAVGAPALTALVGEVAPRVAPAPRATSAGRSGGGQPRQGGQRARSGQGASAGQRSGGQRSSGQRSSGQRSGGQYSSATRSGAPRSDSQTRTTQERSTAGAGASSSQRSRRRSGPRRAQG